ncbi:MAG TPA: flagellar basal-body rod protein FlgF [Verrucomicrobiae bacterium]|nr:flagellar basal-body rod protein FlgF [Verrucomicrobiae bacterium]
MLSVVAGTWIMDSGYYSACAGMAAQTQALDLVAHNLANLGTTGYLAQKATFRSLLAGNGSWANYAMNAVVNNFGVLNGSRTDLATGSLVATGNPLDLAIAGPGFFAIQSAVGVAYTRAGNFQVTAAGKLVTAQGDPVLGEQGQITLPTGAVSVSDDGTISVDGTIIDKLRITEFASNTNLEAAGDALYRAPAGTGLAPAASSVRQGMLEQSNVSAVASVVELITVQRAAEMMQRALSIFDTGFNQTAVQDLPRV